MNGVATMTMDPTDAQLKYDLYRSALEGRPVTTEDRGILIGYKAMARGRAILHLGDVFRSCPVDAKGLPRLAVARADWRWCHFQAKGRWRTPDLIAFAANERDTWGDGRARKILVPQPTKPARAINQDHHRALVPLVPPNLRPDKPHDYHILFEAEWEAVPPKDPMLLRHLHGSLYAVLAAWDLTELERAVLSGRLGERT